MRRFVSPAIVLRTVDYGDADRVVTMLTREAGKLSALARSARKSSRRFGAGLSLFGTGEATLTERAGAELCGLEAFHGARGFPGLMGDMVKVAHGGYIVELVRELLPQRQPEPEIFDLTVAALGLLEAAPARPELLRVFELRLLDAVGLRPTVDACLSCGSATLESLDADGQVFDIRRGGVVCALCHGHGHALDGEARRALCAAQSLGLDEAAGFALTPRVNAACRDALTALIIDHLGRPLKSLEFIAKLNHAHG